MSGVAESAPASLSVPAPVAVGPRWTSILIGTVLGAGTVLLYQRALGCAFVNYDDPNYVTLNPHVQAGLSWAGWQWAFFGHADYWHPLTWLSHMLDWALYGDNAAGHHLTSVVWHALNAVLAWRVLRRLTGLTTASALGAAAWAWHPLRVESVVWITERKDVMSGAFCLLTVWAYAAYRERPGRARYGLTLVTFLAGLACKPTLVALPLGLLALDHWPLGGGRTERGYWRARWREKLPFFALAAIVAIVTVRMQLGTGAFSLAVPLSSRLGNAVVSVGRYLGMTVWPLDLAVCYPHPGTWPLLTVAGVGAGLAGLGGLAWWQRTTRPWFATGGLLFLILLLPTLGVLQVGVQALADRYTYLPSLGLALIVTRVLRTARPARTVGAMLVLAGFAAVTWQQQAVWANSETLFRNAVAVTRDNSFAHAYLAHTLADAGRWTEAEAEAQTAVALNPDNDTALFVLAGARERAGQPAAAIAAYRQILSVRPTDLQSEFLLGGLLAQTGHAAEATTHLRAAARRVPAYRERCLQLALAAQAHGEVAAAAVYFAVYTDLRPDVAEAWLAQGVTLRQLGRVDDALACFARGIALQPDDARPHLAMAELLARRRQFAEAWSHYERALALRPDDASAQAGAGFVLWLLDRRAEAVAHWREALRVQPDFPGLRERIAAASDQP